MRVSTIYRYFPNKYSIISALTQTISLRWREWMEPVYAALADPNRDWRDVLRYSSADWISHARSEPGAVSVLQAINATPELREIHRRIFDRMCEKLIAALRQRGVRLAQARLVAIARTFTASQNAGTEIYLQMNGAEATLFREVLTTSLERYLEVYLEPSDDARRTATERIDVDTTASQGTQLRRRYPAKRAASG